MKLDLAGVIVRIEVEHVRERRPGEVRVEVCVRTDPDGTVWLSAGEPGRVPRVRGVPASYCHPMSPDVTE